MTLYDLAGRPVDDPAGANLTIGDLKFNGFSVTTDLMELVTAADIELSIEEASTLTLVAHDPDRILEKSGVLYEATDLDIGPHQFRFVKVSKADENFTLTFENRWVALLRLNDKPRKASRGKVTRAEFIKSMVDETPGIVFWAPDLHVKQPVTASEQPAGLKTTARPATPRDAASTSRAPGFAPGVHLTIKGEKATAQQLDILSRLLKVADQVNANPLARLAMICSTIGESTVSYEVNSLGYGGPLQAHKSVIAPTDVEQQARCFLLGGKGFNRGGAIALSKTVKDPGEIATLVETSGQPGGFYGRYAPEARAIIAAYTGSSSSSASSAPTTTTTTTVAKRYEFTRGTDNGRESTWDASKRLCDEVGRRRFMVDNEFVCAFDGDLIKQAPAATIMEFANGVNYIDYERDAGKRVESCSVSCRADAWAARPGDVIEVVGSGPADGRWLVSRVSGSLFTVDRTIDLTRATRRLKEPSAETTTKTTTATTADVGGSARPVSGGSSGLAYPLAVHGSDLGGVAAHKARPFGNWQSDNAVDIGCPRGTRVYAVADGTIVSPLSGHWDGTGQSNPNGFNVTLKTADNSWFYTHLRKRADLHVGQQVRRGQYLGESGAANGVDHLHIACLHGDPEALLGVKK